MGGEFDGRNVAVKRIPMAFAFANREAELLRESDQHPNVIRYFFKEEETTQDYYLIAMELCDTSLDKCITKQRHLHGLEPVVLIQQLISGLAHLHSLRILHRDVKPHNILLSTPDQHGQVTVKISDFGMSKKHAASRSSVSRSRALGTEGWSAPELLNEDLAGTVTKAVDIFSAGCVLYYVVTKGTHPFGLPIRRDVNILDGNYNLEALKMDNHDDIVTRDLVEKMLNKDPDRRPSAETVLKHPFFWSKKTILDFLQEAHGWTKKETVEELESGAQEVVRGDWMEHIGEVLKNDLKKRSRKYKGGSVQSLLRAIRNKAQHYADSPEAVRRTLGSVPDGFVSFFTSRFPRLLLHTYLAGGGSS